MPMTDYGRIGRDAELRYTPGNNSTAVINLAVAVDYGRKDPNTGKRPTQWVEVVIWGQQAESLAEYLVKGQGVHFTIGDVHIEEFQSQGVARSKLIGRCIELKLVGGAPVPQQQNQQQGQQQRPAAQQQRQQQSRPQQNNQQQRQAAPQPQPADFDSFDDDIPF
jgi:single-strand DNA-binding protein